MKKYIQISAIAVLTAIIIVPVASAQTRTTTTLIGQTTVAAPSVIDIPSIQQQIQAIQVKINELSAQVQAVSSGSTPITGTYSVSSSGSTGSSVNSTSIVTNYLTNLQDPALQQANTLALIQSIITPCQAVLSQEAAMTQSVDLRVNYMNPLPCSEAITKAGFSINNSSSPFVPGNIITLSSGARVWDMATQSVWTGQLGVWNASNSSTAGAFTVKAYWIPSPVAAGNVLTWTSEQSTNWWTQTGSKASDKVLLISQTVPSLGSKQSFTKVFSTKLPGAILHSTGFVIFVADEENTVSEANENNNVLIKAVVIS